jgi:MoaA/NifB/PqqE/SkfB family radical SAM enzyme
MVGSERMDLKKRLDQAKLYLKYYFSYFLSYPLVYPKEVNFQMTNRCNLRCKMCNIWKLRKKEKEISVKEMKRILKEIKENWNTKYVSFVGGEALLRYKDTLELIRYANKLGFITNLVTNCSLLNEKTCKELVKVGMKRIALSLDGATPKTHDFIRGKGNFKQVLNAAKILLKLKKRYPLKIDFTTVVMSYNFRELIDLYWLAKRIGVDQWFLQSVVLDNTFQNFNYDSALWIKGKDLEELKRIIKKLIILKLKDPNFIYNSIYYLKSIPKYFELKEKFNLGHCMAGYYNLNIDPYGYISICNYGPNLNVKRKNVTELWKHKKYKLTRIKIKNCKMPCMMLCYQRFDLLEFMKVFFGVRDGRNF